MLNSIKIKLRTLLLSRKRKANPVFVNPYAPIVPVSTAKINPYVIEYGVVKKKSLFAIIMERLRPETPTVGIPIPEVVIAKEPTFLHDMNEMFIGDVMMIASKFKSRKKKEKVMTSVEILKACENTKW